MSLVPLGQQTELYPYHLLWRSQNIEISVSLLGSNSVLLSDVLFELDQLSSTEVVWFNGTWQ